MFRPSVVISIVVCMLALVSYSNGTQRRSTSPKTSAPVAQAPVAQAQPEPVAAQPPPPPTPEQGPSSPPEVNYQHGQLTITARNSTMSDVLNAVKQKTGAAVDMPAVTSERVVGQFGPGAPRDVMAQLLNGSHYDYVLLGSPADPGALKKIVLTARASGPEPVPPPTQQMANQPLPSVPDVDTEQTSDDTSTEAPQPEMQQAPEEEAQPDQPESAQPGQPVVKTPEQLLRELQQQQQQQQQQMQQNGSQQPQQQ